MTDARTKAAAGTSAGTGAAAQDRLQRLDPGAVAGEWDRLAERSGSPFCSLAWLRPWVGAYAPAAQWWGLRGAGGGLRAAGCFRRTRAGLEAAANVETSHWDVVAADPASRQRMWRLLTAAGHRRLRLEALPDGESRALLRWVLPAAGFAVVEQPDPANPRLALPDRWEDLLAGVSPTLRQQYHRRRRSLAATGPLRLRVITGGPGLERDLETFLRLEASGWKGRRGTALLADPAAAALYRGFAEAAAERGWLRLLLLEVAGRPVAGDLACAFAGTISMLKTAYDEELAAHSPGLVLRGEALRAAVDEGCAGYDFLGAAEPYKLRWGAQVQPYSTITAYRGPYAAVALYHRRLRPALKGVRDRARAARSRTRSGGAQRRWVTVAGQSRDGRGSCC